MTDSRPHHELVTDREEAPESAAAPEPREHGRSGWLSWALAGALLVCGIGWLMSSQRVSELETTLRATTTALLETRDQLRAYDGHLVQVKERASGVSERATALSAEVEALSALLDAGPLGPEAAPAE